MASSVPRCLALLEKLRPPPIKDGSTLESFFAASNVVCENHLRLTLTEITDSNSGFPLLLTVPPVDSDSSAAWTFSKYLQYTILTIVQSTADLNSPLTEQLSPHQLKLLILWINLASDWFLVPNIDGKLLQNQVIQNQMQESLAGKDVADKEERLGYLISSVNTLSEVFRINELVQNEQMSMTAFKYLAGVHTIRFQTKDDSTTLLLDALFDRIPEKYFRFLLMLKSTTSLNKPFNEQLHQDLLRRLQSSDGFEILCKVLLPAALGLDDAQESRLKNVAVMSGIVGRAGHTAEFYANIINQIVVVFQRASNEGHFLGVAMGCLSRIYKLPQPATRTLIEALLFKALDQLSEPGDIITGRIVFEHQEFMNLFRRLRIAFSGSPALTFPSKLLIPFLPVLLQLSNRLPNAGEVQDTITILVTRCLANRESPELGDLIDSLLLEEYYPDSRQLHPRITFKETICQIGAPNPAAFYNPSEVLITLLKASNNNILLYNIFLYLLGQLDRCLLDSATQSPSLAEDIDEMSQLVAIVFKRRIAVIGTLSELINHQPFHGQFNENPAATIECLTQLVRRQTQTHSADSEPIMLVVLSIIRELLEKLQHNPGGGFRHFVVALGEYRLLVNDPAIRNHIDGILRLINEDDNTHSSEVESSAFEVARTLCTASEPHLRVYGLVKFTELIRNGSDAEVLAKRHAILALAIDALRDPDSYVFLNCIRLLVQLVAVLEAEVLEAMVVEYRSDGADVDFRLKVGEVLVKVAEQLGPLAIRYKDILINCFLLGSVHRNDELRSSSLSSLGTICRLLSYQVTSFFHELMHITHTTIASDSYAPARRAAVMVFADLVQGFDKLQDFEEILLPVYRALKYALEYETDPQTLAHASIGLERLAAKVKVFLTTGPGTDRRGIQVLGVRPEKRSPSKGRSILHIV